MATNLTLNMPPPIIPTKHHKQQQQQDSESDETIQSSSHNRNNENDEKHGLPPKGDGNDDDDDDDIDKEDDDLSDSHSIFARKKRRALMVRRITYMVVMNAAIPIALYYILKAHIPAVWALVLSSTPTIVSVIIQAIFMRRVDSIGIAVIFGFILSVILASTNGDPKLLLLRESFVTAGVGVVCAVTLLPIRIRNFTMKPVLYYLARDLIPLRPVEFKDPVTHPPQKRILFYWNHSPFLRRHLRILTGIDIIILELEFGLKLFYILRFELDTVVILSSSSLSAIGVMIEWVGNGHRLSGSKTGWACG
ncbi:hypothetical protein [Absidia glauca]|uniref:Uncharacterized protein n=1 Tax=Absidia glauca TaxID=4829 RepID=A0A163K9T9_ABSGL|nr:hypothetical protein [Absidia glauca]